MDRTAPEAAATTEAREAAGGGVFVALAAALEHERACYADLLDAENRPTRFNGLRARQRWHDAVDTVAMLKRVAGLQAAPGEGER